MRNCTFCKEDKKVMALGIRKEFICAECFKVEPAFAQELVDAVDQFVKDQESDDTVDQAVFVYFGDKEDLN